MSKVLGVCPGVTEYVGIDPYREIKDKESYHEHTMAHMTQNEWDDLYLQVVSTVVRKNPRSQLIRGLSEDVAKIISDGYFDIVFIDGDHRYEAVLKDIKLWTPKVRKGGWISGHDHIKKSPGVIRAVAKSFPMENCRQHATCWRHEIA